MASLLVRRLEDDLVRRLKERAAEHRAILRAALRPTTTGRELWGKLSQGERAEVDFGGGADQTPEAPDFR